MRPDVLKIVDLAIGQIIKFNNTYYKTTVFDHSVTSQCTQCDLAANKQFNYDGNNYCHYMKCNAVNRKDHKFVVFIKTLDTPVEYSMIKNGTLITNTTDMNNTAITKRNKDRRKKHTEYRNVILEKDNTIEVLKDRINVLHDTINVMENTIRNMSHIIDFKNNLIDAMMDKKEVGMRVKVGVTHLLIFLFFFILSLITILSF